MSLQIFDPLLIRDFAELRILIEKWKIEESSLLLKKIQQLNEKLNYGVKYLLRTNWNRKFLSNPQIICRLELVRLTEHGSPAFGPSKISLPVFSSVWKLNIPSGRTVFIQPFWSFGTFETFLSVWRNLDTQNNAY